MAIVTFSNVTKEFQGETLFSHLNFAVQEKEKVALVGPNGSGKSTLIKLLLGKESLNANEAHEPKGEISIKKGTVIGYLSQDVISDVSHTLLQEAEEVFHVQREKEKEIERLAEQISLYPEDVSLQNLYDRKYRDFETSGGYDYLYLVEMILLKFGFQKEDFQRQISTFSGGERTKMAFAKLLLMKPDFLILDEPTNHLDLSTIDWLEGYLKSYPGTILFVSHDRYFIDALADRIFELEQGKLTAYKGNYAQYLEEKRLRYETLLKEYNMQQKEIEKLKRFIEYFKPKPRFVSRAKDREHKLEHMKKIDKPTNTSSQIHITFQNQSLDGKQLIEFDHLTVGYPSHPLFGPVSFTLFGGDHLAVMGDNGSGKTTFIETLLRHLKPIEGKINYLRILQIGYLKQTDFSLNQCEETLLDYFLARFPSMNEKEIRNHLGKFSFCDDDVFQVISTFSGGEKMRLVLAELVLKKYDILILDEPTNHLDLLTKEALLEALQNYTGTIVFVSHDRYFVDQLANRILYVHHQQAVIEEGNYASLKERNLLDFVEEKESKVEKKVDTRKKNSSKSPLKLQAQLDEIEQKLTNLHALQYEEEYYMDAMKMQALEEEEKKLNERYEEIFQELAELLEN